MDGCDCSTSGPDCSTSQAGFELSADLTNMLAYYDSDHPCRCAGSTSSTRILAQPTTFLGMSHARMTTKRQYVNGEHVVTYRRPMRMQTHRRPSAAGISIAIMSHGPFSLQYSVFSCKKAGPQLSVRTRAELHAPTTHSHAKFRQRSMAFETPRTRAESERVVQAQEKRLEAIAEQRQNRFQRDGSREGI
jgi:hypothetical protein